VKVATEKAAVAAPPPVGGARPPATPTAGAAT